MCIRDRQKEHFAEGGIFDQIYKNWPQAGVRGGWTEQDGSACLLYTSDAADERSSVDLGGRRIIKKKKQ